MRKELEKLTKEQLIQMIEHFEYYPAVTMDDDEDYILAYLEDESCSISEKEIAEYLLKSGVEITRENIFLYYKFMSKESIEKLPFKIQITTTCNIAIRNDDCNKYEDEEDYEFEDDNGDDDVEGRKLRYAVECCYSPTGNKDDIEEYCLDFEYFDTEEEADDFIKNTVLIPENKF